MSHQPDGPKGPVFIVGAPRSGTTLMQYMLRSHPAISIPSGESHFIVPLCRDEAGFGDLSRRENVRRVLQTMLDKRRLFLETDLPGMRFDVDELADEFHALGTDSVPKVISALYAKNARGEGKQRWGDKTPPYVRHLPLLADKFPQARFVHVIRDPRDCVMSMLRRRYDLATYNSYHGAEIWRLFVDDGQAAGSRLGPDRYFELRYEDLLENPELKLRELCGFLDEEYTDGLINFQRPRTPGKTPLLSQALQPENRQKWREAMSPGQIRMIESVTGEVMQRNGYTPVSDPRPVGHTMAKLYAAHNRLSWWLEHRYRTLRKTARRR